MKFFYSLLMGVLFSPQFNLFAQKQTLNYYLPEITYDAAIPTPEAWLGYQIGEWHLSHDQLLGYVRHVAALSDRMTITEYARTYENRPLVYLTITSTANHQNLENIRQQHLNLCDPDFKGELPLDDMPVVLYQGFSIHGNEPSGANAVPLLVYYLAAGQSPEVERLLNESVILLDPSFNPDGFQRFSTWANMHKNANLTDDPHDREYNEVWPGGRTNHYWFDLNRDWLPVQHPESRGRVALYHQWKPNVLTDHHEMGTNATFFFMPGVPVRTNPNTPEENQILTGKIADFHGEALDKIGSLYYTREGYDDFYYGKGSTYPDANGGIGILFEQASSRGHLQRSENGPLSFPFTIRNQLTTALSTQKAAISLRKDLLSYQQRFFRDAIKEAAKDQRKAFVFGESSDPQRVEAFVDILNRHQIKIFRLAESVSAAGQLFEKERAFVVPASQQQYKVIRAIFDTTTSFKDSIFYDISSWTLPLAFNIPYAALESGAFRSALLGEEVQANSILPAVEQPAKSEYAYLMEWPAYYAPAALYQILENGLRAKVATLPFQHEGRSYPSGTLIIAVQNQGQGADQIWNIMREVASEHQVHIHPVKGGMTVEGIDLGSPSFDPVALPKIALMAGSGVWSYEAGEIWHLLDQRYGIKVSKLEPEALNYRSLDSYNVIIMPGGNYTTIGLEGAKKLMEWSKNGGTIIALGTAINWLKQRNLVNVNLKASEGSGDSKKERRPYGKLGDDRGAEEIGGAIFEVQLDLTHPLCYGFTRNTMPIFKNNEVILEPAKNAYATPLLYDKTPLLSGYLNDSNRKKMQESASVVVSGVGNGKTICIAENPNFRAFWYGTNKLFANAIFFGKSISSGAVEKASGISE
ncbi:MAG TPA: M14 family metallopeptidase [Saprospiraceae bacterium]|nr:M14 family metallopeptidase [Saprospiraceae bacterium]HMQ85715.1 M14 family metallopeptidase [Saprospiraceae bacterium]